MSADPRIQKIKDAQRRILEWSREEEAKTGNFILNLFFLAARYWYILLPLVLLSLLFDHFVFRTI